MMFGYFTIVPIHLALREGDVLVPNAVIVPTPFRAGRTWLMSPFSPLASVNDQKKKNVVQKLIEKVVIMPSKSIDDHSLVTLLKLSYAHEEEREYFNRDVVIGPIINSRQVEKIQSLIEKSIQQGARVVKRGRVNGTLMEPTMLAERYGNCTKRGIWPRSCNIASRE